MIFYIPVSANLNDTVYVSSFGYANTPDATRWGPGSRKLNILHYVVSGEGYFNGVKVRKNQGFYIHSRMFHEYHSDPQKPWEYYWFIFSDELANKYALPYVQPDENHIFSFDFADKIVNLFEKITVLKRPLSHLESLSCFFQCMSYHTLKREVYQAAPITHIQNAKAYIEENINKKISVKNVASAIHIDDRYLYNLFVREEHITPKEYISQKKVAYAKSLLKTTNLTVTEIADYMGFEDTCSFSSFFTRLVGCSPNAHRKALSSFAPPEEPSN